MSGESQTQNHSTSCIEEKLKTNGKSNIMESLTSVLEFYLSSCLESQDYFGISSGPLNRN